MKSKSNAIEEAYNILKNGYNKQIILYGPPGTSKTYSATIVAAKLLGWSGTNQFPSKEEAEAYLEGANNRFKLVQFHPSYSYEDFVRGISVNTDESTSSIKYSIEPKMLETFSNDASKDGSKAPYVLIIDEINRAPLASVLGELIYGLEYRDKEFSTPYILGGSDKIKIADNLYIIGTMNTADRSIGSIDYAVRRRFAFVKVPSSPDAIETSWNKIGESAKSLYIILMDGIELSIPEDKKDEISNNTGISAADLSLFSKKKGIFDKDYLADQDLDVDDIKIGHTYFLGNKEKFTEETAERSYLNYRLDYQIKPIYEEYVKDGIIKRSGLKQLEVLIKFWEHKDEIDKLLATPQATTQL